jgi:phosphogluconate dehydratase
VAFRQKRVTARLPAQGGKIRMTTQLNARVGEVTNRIVERSRRSRQAYLARIDSVVAKGPARKRHSCANFAHGFAACGPGDKEALREGTGANLAIVTAYNDMLSAHQPYARFPDLIKEAARAVGGTAQVAGGVPAMCDGVTQGE